MKTVKTFAATAAVAVLALAATDLAASAQTMTKRPGHAMVRHGSLIHARPRTRVVYRPLVVRPAPVVVAAPVVTGPGTLVTGPLSFGSNVAALPFRGLNTIFPASGDVAANPLVLIGAPLRAVSDIVQIPFRIVGEPFGGTSLATY